MAARPKTGGLVLALLLVMALPAPVRAVIIYETSVGFRQPSFNNSHSGLVPTPINLFEFSFGGSLCPAPGGHNYLCGKLVSDAGLVGSRLFLKSAARFERTDADEMARETAAYADTSIWITTIHGYTGTAPNAVFYFGLGGNRSATTNRGDVTVQAFAVATLYAGNNASIQCFADFDCIPKPDPYTMHVTNWDPGDGLRLVLRADVAAVADFGAPGGWDAEVVAEFADTLELLAIQLRDENDDPIPGVTLTAPDNNGQPIITFPNEPPVATPTPTSTPTLSATPTLTTTGTAAPGSTATATVAGPTVTPTPCVGGACEDCENCVDDDGDFAVDRADPDCPVADGSHGGLGDANGKALDKCAKAIRKAGAKLTATRFKLVGSCVKAVADCVQLKPGQDGCLTNARAKCAKARGMVAPAGSAIGAQIGKACGAPLTGANLVAVGGLGFDGEAASCARHGIATLQTVGDVAECLGRIHVCAVDRMLGAVVPRARELLTLGGWDPAELACLGAGSDGGGAGLSDAKRKAIRKCDAAVQKATAKLVAARAKLLGACGAQVFTCFQTKPNDDECVDKARTKCLERSDAAGALGTAFAAAIAKACGTAPLEVADLLAPEGLGATALAAPCAALGVASLASVADVAGCLEKSLACRVDQLLINEAPRFVELLQAGTTAP